MTNEAYNSDELRASVLRAAAHSLIELREFEFLAGDPDLGLALAQLQLYLLRISEGLQPFAYGAREFLNALRTNYRRIETRRRLRAKRSASSRARQA